MKCFLIGTAIFTVAGLVVDLIAPELGYAKRIYITGIVVVATLCCQQAFRRYGRNG